MKDIEQPQEEELEELEELEQVDIKFTTLEAVGLALTVFGKLFLILLFGFVYLAFAHGICEEYIETKNPNDAFIFIGVTIMIIMLRIWYLVENPKKEDQHGPFNR